MIKDLIPDLHDWEITGLDVNRETREVGLKLWFPDDGEKARLLIKGVSQLSYSGAMLQNVILDLLIFERDSNSDYLKYCYKILNINPSIFSSNGTSAKKVLFIEPSVGIELACCYTSLIYEILD